MDQTRISDYRVETPLEAPLTPETPETEREAAPRLFAPALIGEAVPTQGDDILRADGEDDRIRALRGDDRVTGGGGDDTLIGSGGNDTLKGGADDDFLKGGRGNDRLLGGGGDDRLNGGGGADFLRGGGGADSLNGGGGADNLSGGGGDDTLLGSRGDDTLKGGGGNDRFIFRTADFNAGETDEIRAFQFGRDIIDLSRVNGMDDFDSFVFTTSGSDVILNVGGGRIVFKNAQDANRFTAFDFGLTDFDPTQPTVEGSAANDVITGNASDQLIRGLGGNDTLGTAGGVDTLEGGTGADNFVIRRAEGQAGNIDPATDIVADFDYIGGDTVSLNEILAGVSFDALEGVVQLTAEGGGTMVRVATDGTFRDALFLDGVSFTLEELALHGIRAPEAGDATFEENPYGFQNRSHTQLDPDGTRDGRFIAYVDLLNSDANAEDETPGGMDLDNLQDFGTMDVFVRNLETKTLFRVSSNPDGTLLRQGDGSLADSMSPDISEDGKLVAFVTNGVGSEADTNGSDTDATNDGDIYIRNVVDPTQPLELVTALEDGSASGGVPVGDSIRTTSGAVLALSADGRKIAFITKAQGYVPELGTAVIPDEDRFFDANDDFDVYWKDLDTGEVRLVSARETDFGAASDFNAVGGVPNAYKQNDDFSAFVQISEDGRRIAYVTDQQVLAEDTDAQEDVYVLDLDTGRTILVSTEDGLATAPSMSADGTRIAYNLTPDGANGTDVIVAEIDYAAGTSMPIYVVGDGEAAIFTPPDLSPDGTRIAYADRDGNSRQTDKLFLEDVGGGNRETFTYSQSVQGNVAGSDGPGYDILDTGFVYRDLLDAGFFPPNRIGDTILYDVF